MNKASVLFFLSFILLANITCKSSEQVRTEKNPIPVKSTVIDTTATDTTATDSTAADSTEEDKNSYDEIVDKADKTEKGLMNVYRVKKKLYLEVPLSLMGREMLLGSTISKISESDLGTVGAKPHAPLHLAFTRLDSTILLRKIRKNSIAPETYKALNRALANNSIGTIFRKFDVKAFNKDSSAAVIEVTNFLVGDVKALSPFGPLGMNLPRGMTHKASFKKERSFLGDFESFEDNVSIKSHLSYEFDIIYNKKSYLSNQPFTAVMTRTFVLLPEHPVRPRIADPRIGVGTTSKYRFLDPGEKAGGVHFARRFQLIPSDVEAYQNGEMVEPVYPITFYVDRNFPESWKEPIKKGIEDWNKAFEKIGFRNAVAARDYPENDPEFDPDNLKYNVVRYAPNDVQNILAPSWIDPRTGEILNASLYVYHDFVKLIDRWRFVQTAQVDKAIRTETLPDPQKKQDIRYFIRRQFGYALGFKANNAASSSIPVDSLRSPEFTQKYGTTYSIMDNAHYNFVAQPGDRNVRLTAPMFGPYDYYIVKWNYKYFPTDKYTQAEEREVLKKMVDEKADDIRYRYGKNTPLDPSVQGGDLGDNAIEASRLGIKNLKYIIAHLNEWLGDEDKDYSYRREIWAGITQQYIKYLNHVNQNIGGVYLHEKYQGDPRPRFRSVPRAKQEAAFNFMVDQIRDLDWLMDENVIKNFTLTNDLPSILQEEIIQILLNIPREVYISAMKSEEKNPYTTEAAMQDLYEAVWKKTIEKKKLDQVDIALQKAYVGSAIKRSGLPVPGSEKSGAPAFAAAFAGSNSIGAAMLSDKTAMNIFDAGIPGNSTVFSGQLVNYYGMSGTSALRGENERSASFSGLGVRFNLGPTLESRYYLYMKKVKSLLEQCVEQTSDSTIKAHYLLLLHQLEKILA